MGRRFLPYSTSTQYTCLIQSASDPQNLYPTPCTLGIKVDKDPSLFNVSSPLSFPGVLTVSPTLINFILLSFCLISGNSFPTHTRTRTELSWCWENVAFYGWAGLVMFNSGTQCTMEGRGEAKGWRNFFMINFFFSCHKIWILLHITTFRFFGFW